MEGDAIRVGVIHDGYDSESHFDEMEETCGMILEQIPSAKIVFKGRDVRDGLRRVNLDVLVIDYGGMAVSWGWDTAIVNVDATLRWAEDHPSSLLLFWSDYTRLVFERELESSFGPLPQNVMASGPGCCWIDMLDEVARRFGAPRITVGVKKLVPPRKRKRP